MSTKVCFRCQCEKPLEAFYAHPRMADGRLGKCKECTKADTKANREDRKDYYQAYDRRRGKNPDRVSARLAYQQTDAYRESLARSHKKWEMNNRVKRKAQTAVNNAIRDGRLTKQPCHICGELEVEGHHPDYSAPLDVVWLCTKHHAQLHEEHREYERQLSMSNKPLTDQQIVVH